MTSSLYRAWSKFSFKLRITREKKNLAAQSNLKQYEENRVIMKNVDKETSREIHMQISIKGDKQRREVGYCAEKRMECLKMEWDRESQWWVT